MGQVFFGFDFGATTTDLVMVKRKKITANGHCKSKENWLESFQSLSKKASQGIEAAGVTGKKPPFGFGKEVGFPSIFFDEVQAIGLGGVTAVGLKKAVVSSAGTGTCVVFFNGKKAQHLGGTGVGGGTLLGLSKLLGAEKPLKELGDFAGKGKPSMVNLSVFEAVGKKVGLCPKDATASNFGKISSTKKEDLIAGVFKMVGETIGVVSCLGAKCTGSKKVVFVGRATEFKPVKKAVKETVKLFSMKPFFPKNSGSITAFGAALLAEKEVSKNV